MDTNIKTTGLFEAFLMLESIEEVEKFLLDLCTPQELKAFKERWKVCQLLNSGNFSYRSIRDITGASTSTITRVARFLNSEPYQGYKAVLNKFKKGEQK